MTAINIIGGGVIGLATAYRCAKRGVRVTLHEKNTLGSGATLASLGALWPPRASRVSALQRLQLKSLWMFEEFVREIEAASKLKIRFERLGHLELLTSEKSAGDAKRDVEAAGVWPTFDHAAAQSLVAASAPLPIAGVTPTPFGALHSHISAQVRVDDYIAALRRACEALGVAIYENAPIETLPASSGDSALLITAGAWAARLTKCAPTFPVKGQAIEIESAEPLPQTILKRGIIYIIPWLVDGKHRALIGATTEKEAGFDKSVSESATDALLAEACEILPQLRSVKIVRRWAGLRPGAPKGRPIMGKIPGTQNAFVSAGHYKTGIGLSPFVSLQNAAMILGEPLDADFLTFAPK